MEIIRIDDDPVPAARRAAEVLARGGVVIYPTDTVYGMAVDALNRPAIELLKKIKGRERKKPISIVVPHMKALKDHVTLTPEVAAFAERYLPGPLTLVLPAEPHIPEELTLNGTIGIRISDDPFVDALAHRFARPFTATSANRAGMPSATRVEDALAQFGIDLVDIDLVIDAGERTERPPSTVVTFIDGVPRILREGALSKEDLGIA